VFPLGTGRLLGCWLGLQNGDVFLQEHCVVLHGAGIDETNVQNGEVFLKEHCGKLVFMLILELAQLAKLSGF
jgi:hypothetical protein